MTLFFHNKKYNKTIPHLGPWNGKFGEFLLPLKEVENIIVMQAEGLLGKCMKLFLKKKHLAPTAKINVSGNIYKQTIYREHNF